MSRLSRSFVAVCAVASLLVVGAGVGPASAKTINGCVIKAKTKCVNADLRGANLKGAEKHFETLKTGALLDALGLTRYCCRRHMLTTVDMMDVI